MLHELIFLEQFMRRIFIGAAFVITAPLLAGAQSLGDMDISGRFEGMPPGTDRYRPSGEQTGLSIPLDPPKRQATFDRQYQLPTPCASEVKRSSKQSLAEAHSIPGCSR